MMLTWLVSKLRSLSLLLLVLLLSFLVETPVRAQTMQTGDIPVSNPDWSVQDGTALISFQLNAPAGQQYTVGIVLRREGNPSFRIVPKSVEGDIGVITVSEGRLRVQWDYKKDVPQGLQGNDYFFEINVERVSQLQQQSSSWLYYVAGGAALLGGGAALLLSKDKSTTETPARELPGPPIRPVP